MNSETGFIPLRDLSLRITKGTTPTKEQGFTEKGINYIKSECITPDGNIDSSKFTYIGADTHQKLGRSKLIEGNVLFSMAGIYLGKSAVVLSKHLPANTNQAVGIITLDPDKADPYFIHYAIQAPAVRSWVMRSAAQSAQPNFNLQEIGDLKIPALTLQSQKEIAGVLRSLDDRIALLRETNATLEAIVQALFKSWFVDFDPVHANAGTQAPSLPAEIQALFPSRLVESPQGLIPEGWEVGCLSDLCSISSGKRPEIRSDNSGDSTSVPLYGGAGIMGYTNRTLFDGKKILTGRVGTLGKVHIATPPFWASDNVLVLTPKSDDYFYFSLNWLMAIDVHSLNRGSTQPLLTQKDLGAQLRAIPPKNICGEFDKVVLNIYLKIESNNTQADSLSNLRDTLLPRLISGQLPLPEAEAELSEVLT